MINGLKLVLLSYIAADLLFLDCWTFKKAGVGFEWKEGGVDEREDVVEGSRFKTQVR